MGRAGTRDRRSAAFPGGPEGRASSPRTASLAADLNYDYRTDLVLAGAGGLRLLRQGEDGALHRRDRRRPSSLRPCWARPRTGPGRPTSTRTATSTWCWHRSNGPPVVLRNNGDGTFAERRPFPGAGACAASAGPTSTARACRTRRCSTRTGTVRVFLNLRGGDFRERPLPPGFPKAVAVAVAEASGDAHLRRPGPRPRPARSLDSPRRRRRPTWEIAERRASLRPPVSRPGSARLVVADLDNNGADDLVVAGPAVHARAAGRRLRRVEGARAPRVGALGAPGPSPTSTVTAGSESGAGERQTGALAAATSRGRRAYHWQALRPRAATATGDQRINSFGIGGEVEVRTGLHVQKQAHRLARRPLRPRRGARVRTWCASSGRTGCSSPSSTSRADATLLAEQRLKGSCPWLFAWNGREMAFVTDLIWRSPLGLRINAAGHRRRAHDRRLGEGARRPAGRRATAPTTCASPPSCGRPTSSTSSRCWWSTTRRAPRSSWTSASRSRRRRSGRRGHRAGAARCGRCATTGAGTCPTWCARATAATSTSRAAAPTRASPATTSWRSSCRRTRRARAALARGPGLGASRPTAPSTWPSRAGRRAAPRGLSLHVADPAGRFREVRQGLGLPRGQGQDGRSSTSPASSPRRARGALRLATNLEIFWDRLGWAEGRPDVVATPRRVALRLGRPALPRATP